MPGEWRNEPGWGPSPAAAPFSSESSVKQLLMRFIRDESGQDLIEYGLLAASIAAAGAAVLPGLRTAMGQAFSTWGNNIYGVWVPNDPL